MTQPLLHLTPSSSYDAAAGTPFTPASFSQDGGVACATVDQVAGAARLLFAGTLDLTLLVIDPRRLGDVAIRWQDVYGVGQEFPLLDGPVPPAAIVEVRPFPPGPGGRWRRPDIAPLPDR